MTRFTLPPTLLLFAGGGLSALALPGREGWWAQLWWILALTLPLLLRRIEAAALFHWKAGFRIGFVFGFGYFCVALHWIGFAFFIDAKATGWMMPFAVGGLAAFLALYWGAAAALAVSLPTHVVPRWLGLAALIAGAEWLRGHLLTGFPWGAPGLVAEGMGGVAQLASLVGMTGLTFLVLLWGFAPFLLWRNRRAAWRSFVFPVAVVLSLPVALLWGTWRLADTPTVLRDDVRLRIVQPNIEQSDKWRSDNSAAIFETLLSLSGDASAADGIVIWPESAVPFLLDEDADALARIADVLGPGRRLLTGAIRRDAASSLQEQYYASVLLIDGMGAVRGIYDKWRLVPGGEFLPFEPLLAWAGFRKVVSLPESFAPGPGPRNLSVPDAGLAGVLICYEAIFPHRLLAETRPAWLVNVTNDGWFDGSVGPQQHLAQMRLRAIEQGLPVARAANTGISAIIDPLGRITAQGASQVTAVVAGSLPAALKPTLYSRLGDVAVLLLVGVFIFGWKLLPKT